MSISSAVHQFISSSVREGFKSLPQSSSRLKMISCTNVNWVFCGVGAGLFNLFAAFKSVGEPYRIVENGARSELKLTVNSDGKNCQF
jgi:hypothetical protein